MKQIKSSNGLKIQNFFDEVLNELQGVKVESVFSCAPLFLTATKYENTALIPNFIFCLKTASAL